MVRTRTAVSRLGTSVGYVATPLSTVAFLVIGLPAGAWTDRLRRRPVLGALLAAPCGFGMPFVAEGPRMWLAGAGWLVVTAVVGVPILASPLRKHASWKGKTETPSLR